MSVRRVRHVAVVGGGISGLAAAYFLGRDGGPDVRVTVLEGSPQIGGKLRVRDLAGIPVDEGAESLLLRRPEGVALAQAVGLGSDLVDAQTVAAFIWSRGHLRPIPAGTVMGVPGDLRALAASGLLGPRELARVPVDAWLPQRTLGADVGVGAYVASRMGRAVVERLVEPLLGGVYAGRADQLSLDATMPQLMTHARRERSLLAAVRAARFEASAGQGGSGDGRPVFGSLRGGLGRLPAAVAAASGAAVRTGAAVRELRRTPQGWVLTLGPASSPELVEADAVVLAAPASAVTRLLRPDVPSAAAELATLRHASMAVVSLAFPGSVRAAVPAGSGFLVPPVERRYVKAATFTTGKWGWYAEIAPDLVVVRLSVGRLGDEEDLQRDDADILDRGLADLTDALGVTEPPVDARVTRWGGGLPQYAVGHRARVERVRVAVAAQPGLAVCGAAYDGIGIPACVASAERAASELLRQWRDG